MRTMLMGLLAALFLVGCGAANTKVVTKTMDDAGRPVEVTQYEQSDTGSYNENVARITGDSDKVDPDIAALGERTKCAGCTQGEKTWADAFFALGAVSIVNAKANMRGQVIRDMKKPKEWTDVVDNAIDRNTIPLLGSIGLTGWVVEALSGGLGSTYNVDTDGGDILDSMNDIETHFTGSSPGGNVNVEIMRRATENFFGPVTNN